LIFDIKTLTIINHRYLLWTNVVDINSHNKKFLLINTCENHFYF
jgi:hypothetical protein